MDTTKLNRFRTSLLEKQSNINELLNVVPSEKKAVLLGPSNQEEVLTHLHTIEESVEKTEAGTLGICTVCGETVEDELLEVDYTADVCFAHLSSEEITRLENEIELARTIQKALLPQETPSIPGMDVAAYSRPAEYLGGDYFDFIDFSAVSHGLVIADVAGHGVSASLQMASLQALARAIVPTTKSPAEVIAHIHKLFRHNIRFTTFVTIFIGAFDSRSKTLTYCNAGHNPPLLLHSNHGQRVSIEWLHPTGPAIGLVEETEFNERTLSLVPRDLLILYTDGVIEATDPSDDLYGSNRFMEVAKRLHNPSSKEVVRVVKQSLEEFVADKPLSDDTTLVVCKII